MGDLNVKSVRTKQEQQRFMQFLLKDIQALERMLRDDWFETDIRQAFPAGTWSDAKRASHRFAKRLATEVSAN